MDRTAKQVARDELLVAEAAIETTMAANDDKEAEEKFKEEEEDHFSRLPDDVVIHLFNTLADAESLCKCSLVSKRCASLIPLIDTLSLSLAASDSNQFLSLNFFQKLNRIRYLRIDLPSHILARGDGFKWGANFGAGLESVTLLHATSLCQAIEFQSEADEIQNGMGIITKSSSDLFPNLCLREALLREATLSQFVSDHPTLESIVVTDSTDSAVRLFLTGNRLVEMRNWAKAGLKRKWDSARIKLRSCCVSVLRLPQSGYVMEGARLVLMKLVDDLNREDAGEEEEMLASFEGEKGVFQEALVEILAKCKGGFRTSFHWTFGYASSD